MPGVILPESGPGRAHRRWMALVALLPILIFLATVLSPPMNHDVAAILDFTQRWRGGEALYRDLIDMNPPLIFVLTWGPVRLAELLGASPIRVLTASALALCGLSLGLIWRLRPGLTQGPIEARGLAFALPLILLAAGYDFAQREHLMLVAAMPYLMLSARRAEGLTTSSGLVIGVALLAAAGFALKPYFLALPALVELHLLWRRGWGRSLRDPVPWIMALFMLGYLAAIRLFFPDYLEISLPLALAYYRPAGTLADVLLNERMTPALLLFLPVAWFAFRKGGGSLAPVLALAGLGALIGALVQQRAWTYHVLPIRLMGGLLLVLLLARWLDRALPAGQRPGAAPGFAALAVALLGLHSMQGAEAPWRELNFARSWPGVFSAALGRVAGGGRVLVLSPDIHPLFPAINDARMLSTLPTMNIWLLQGAYAQCLANGERYRDVAEMGAGERGFHDAVLRGFTQRPPEALMVARHTGIPRCGRDFDLLEYFSRDPGFAATFRRYRLTDEFPHYRIFRREDP